MADRDELKVFQEALHRSLRSHEETLIELNEREDELRELKKELRDARIEVEDLRKQLTYSAYYE